MKYYKIVLNANIIGVGTTSDCLRYQAKHSMLERTSDEKAEYIQCSHQFYHAGWMQPIKTNIYDYIVAEIISIEEQEYNILAPAVDNQPIPIENDDDDDEPTIIDNTDPIDEMTLEYVRTAKINEMSNACRTTIENGFDLDLYGTIHHFSLGIQDQINLINLSAMAQTQELIPYHADGETTTFYTVQELNQIIDAATSFKVYHTTYFNALKNYINSLETIEDIAAITYGVEIPEEYQSDVLKILQQ